MEEGLRHGSMLPYVDTATRQGYGVVILNPNANFVFLKDDRGITHKVVVGKRIR